MFNYHDFFSLFLSTYMHIYSSIYLSICLYCCLLPPFSFSRILFSHLLFFFFYFIYICLMLHHHLYDSGNCSNRSGLYSKWTTPNLFAYFRIWSNFSGKISTVPNPIHNEFSPYLCDMHSSSVYCFIYDLVAAKGHSSYAQTSSFAHYGKICCIIMQKICW